MGEFTKIVLTGGPCAGKSTAEKYIKAFCDANGINVIFVPESATEILKDKSVQRATPEFRKMVYDNQLKNEKLAEEKAEGKTLIVCDRGTMDSGAYCDPETHKKFLKVFLFCQRLDISKNYVKRLAKTCLMMYNIIWILNKK